MRRKTLGKHYYKSKKKRVKRRRTKTRKVGGGFSNIFRRPPTEIDDSLKQRIKNIKEAAEKLETLHATDEGKALFDKLLEKRQNRAKIIFEEDDINQGAMYEPSNT